MKKSIALVLSIVMLLVLVVGCADTSVNDGDDANDTAADDTAADDTAADDTAADDTAADDTVTDEEVTITYQTPSATDMFTKAFAVYQESHPNVQLEVQITDTDTYNQKLLAQADTGTVPDVTWWNGQQFVGANATGAFLDLTDIIGTQFADTFVDGSFLMSTTDDGALTCFPCEMQIQGFIVNKNLFAEYNLEIPETFDELITCAETFADGGEVTLFGNGSADPWPTWGWYHWFQLWGIDDQADALFTTGELKYSESDVPNAYKKMIELNEAGAFPFSSSTVTYDMTRTLLLSEKCAAMTTSTDWLTDIVGSDLDKSGALEYWFGVTFSDSPYNQDTCVKMVGNGYGVSSSVDDAKLAVIVDFFKWFYSQEGANIVLADGLTLPIEFDVTIETTPLIDSILDLTMNTTREGVITADYASLLRFDTNVDIWLESAQTQSSIVNGCLDGSITLADLDGHLADYDAAMAACIEAFAALED